MRVRETMMSDGDVIHYWNTVDDVRNSGRLDFVFEQINEDEYEDALNRYNSIDDVEQLVKEFAPSYIFIVED